MHDTTATITTAPIAGPTRQPPDGIARCTRCGLVTLTLRRPFCRAARQCPRCLNGRLQPIEPQWEPTRRYRPRDASNSNRPRSY